MKRQELLLKIQNEYPDLYKYLRREPDIDSIIGHIEDAHPGEIYLLNRVIGGEIGYLGLDLLLTAELRFQ